MNIGDYKLVGELHNDNSGYAKWGFAKKDRDTYFIKEFLSPIFPLDDAPIGPDLRLKKRQICNAFEKEKRSFYDKLSRCNTGNIVTIEDFFRYKSKYYVVTEKVEHDDITPSYVANNFTHEQKMILFKVLLHNFAVLHENGIIHGDIKPSNVLIKKTKLSYTAKIIDFDSSYFENSPPSFDEIQGDTVYMSPEIFLLISTEEYLITRKTDVFSLGLLLHEFYTGKLPEYDKSKYSYVFEAVLDDDELSFDSSIPSFLRYVIEKMLRKNPSERPNMKEVFETIQVSGEIEVKSTKKVYTIKKTDNAIPKTQNSSSFFMIADDDML